MLNAQIPCDSTPVNCSWNLLNPIFSVIDSANCVGTSCGSNAQLHYGISADATNGFHDVSYSGDKNDANQSCGQSNGCTEDYDATLKIYVYFPKHDYTYSSETCNGALPCMILFHAGGYSDCSSIEDGENIKIMARAYAKRGFVCYVVEYRRGKIEDPRQFNGTGVGLTSAQKMLAFGRAIADGRGAIRHIIYRQQHEGTIYNDKFRIDLSKIFLGGMSAGTGIAINNGFYEYQGGTYDQLNTILPGISNANVLGSINQNYYDCNGCSFNYYNNTSNVKILGVMGCWGVGLLPASILDIADATNYFSHNHNLPAFVGWCGYQDEVAPPEINDVRFSTTSSGPNYNSESNCLITSPYTFSLNPATGGTPDLVSAGSISIYQFLKSANLPAELYIDGNMHHGISNFVNDNFSCSPSSEADVYTYIVGRSATFFQAVMNNIWGSLDESLFVNCYNARNKCDVTYNSGCGNIY